MLERVAMVVALASMLATAANPGPSVIVNGVTIEGTVSTLDSRVDDYFGIPYATASRWSPPKKHAPLNNPFDASNLFKVAVCPQNEPVVIVGVTLTQSEDCLSLSVFVPASAKTSSKLRHGTSGASCATRRAAASLNAPGSP